MTTRTQPAGTTVLRGLQVTAGLTVANLAYQFVTAGQLFPEGASVELHAAGAIVLHVLSGLAAIAAFLLWRSSGGALWPTVLAAVVFVLTFVQASTGNYEELWIHVPGALVLTVGSVWVAAWSFSGSARD